MIDYLLSVNPRTFWLAGYPRENEGTEGTQGPIEHTWSSRFIGWSAQRCWDCCMASDEKGLDWQSFALVDTALAKHGFINLCYDVTEDEHEQWKE